MANVANLSLVRSEPAGAAIEVTGVSHTYAGREGAVPALTDISVADWPHPLGLNDFYLGDEDFEHPMGSVHLATGSGSLGGGSIGRDSVAFMLTCEDLPDRDNRLRLQDDGHLVLHYVPNNGEPVQQLRRRVLEHLQAVGGHLLHVPSADERVRQRLTTQPTLLADQAGTARFGEDPSTSVLDVNCRAHEVDNLYVVDASFFPSIGAVDPALTVIANALRVGDRLVSRLGPSSRRAAS